ncbi:ankyrin repeat domain-containing protein [Candidatus Babeliales bacterium]|nr:ankyrin repeat domain-containing protein [Candidatus Babeliales bacterium]
MNKKLLLISFLCITEITLSAQQNIADLNVKLRTAAFSGNKNKVQDLLQNGADVNAQNSYGMTALIFAAVKGHDGCVQLLLDTPCINVNAQNTYGQTALICAATHGMEPCVQLLLDHKASIEIQDNENQSAYNWAITRRHQAIANMLKKPDQK